MLIFFQAEDGIRVGHVTGVQTCALPISVATLGSIQLEPNAATIIPSKAKFTLDMRSPTAEGFHEAQKLVRDTLRSEERRVGKECSVGSSAGALRQKVTCSTSNRLQ